MKKCMIFFIMLILLKAITFSNQLDILSQRFVQGELIVKFKNDINVRNFDIKRNITNIFSFDSISSEHGLISLEKIGFVPPKKENDFPVISRMFLLKFPLECDLDELIKIYERNPSVNTIFKNFIGEYYFEVNDPYFNEQWGLYDDIPPRADVRAKEAWDIEKGKEEIIL